MAASSSRLVARVRCRRARSPSRRRPTVTRACQRPSAPRYRVVALSAAAALAYRASALPSIGVPLGRDEPVELGALDPHGAAQVHGAQPALGDLPLDAAPGPAQLGGDLVQVEQEGGLGAGCGVHAPRSPLAAASRPAATPPILFTTPVSAQPTQDPPAN